MTTLTFSQFTHPEHALRMLYAAFAQSPLTAQPGDADKLEVEVAILKGFDEMASEWTVAPQYGPMPVPELVNHTRQWVLRPEQAAALKAAVLSIGWPVPMKADALELVRALS